MRTTAVFLDGSGVLLDEAAMPGLWQRALGRYLAARLGGEPERWEAANGEAFPASLARLADAAKRAGPRKGSMAAHLAGREAWLADVCGRVGVALPEDPAAFAEAAQRACASEIRAPLGDAVAAVRALSAAGYTLYTSSALPSWDLEAYLGALGIRDRFEKVYGCDLVDRWKTGPHYYRAICADAGVDPRRAVTVDDTAIALDWARAVKMRTFLLGGQGGGQRHERIASLLELEPLL